MTSFATREQQPPATSALGLKIDRVYQPRLDTLDALVDVLYLLLVDEPESALPIGLSPTCFPKPPE